MTTYPRHGVHVRRPSLNLLVVLIALLAAIIGVGAWLLVDHYTGSSTKTISDAQAITFIQTGAGLPGLNVVNANPNLHGSPLPANARPYAIRMYRSGPYEVRALNLFYAVGAATAHVLPTSAQQAILGMDRAQLIAQAEARATQPKWITQYGITVREAATATVRGMLIGART